ncbi:glycoside hydrolase domain-containing protein [Pilimelia anulata]|uniref:glycoside hydrolase domain-containing protein n=1 Tax=Pilimelia anulata TaxID=53371 RepID=UPI00166B3A5F|nr:glycoside hydrolase domain-containing protein [Pilimelia anulata]
MADSAVVEQGQRWANATYGKVAGYRACAVTGRADAATVASWTMGLQYELGITTLAASFGPATLARLAERGGVPMDERNANLARIVQYALHAREYDAGPVDGTISGGTRAALRALAGDAGVAVGAGKPVPPKLVKAMLTLDAHRLRPGGSAEIRKLQQWLNGAHLGRRDFFVGPADGRFGRDTHRALILAVQFALGMTDDQANGALGPASREGLRGHPVGEGAGGEWARLLLGGLVANGYGRFGDRLDAEAVGALKRFQEFSALPASGRGDYPTWAQLLASNGDPERAGTATDGIATVTAPRARALHAAGYRVLGRYLDEQPGGTLNKEIQPGELDTIFGHGLRVFPISQYWGGERDYFTRAQGLEDAAGAHAAAVKYGFNRGTVIYFAVDYDATAAQIDSHILPYFEGVVAGLAEKGKRYVHGIYGSRHVCAQISARTGARWSFVAGMSSGYSGNVGHTLPENWSFNQVQGLSVGTGDGKIPIDKNIHRPGTDPGAASVNDPAATVDELVAHVDALHARAVGDGSGDPARLVLGALRHDGTTGGAWRTLGGTDPAFAERVRAAGVPVPREVRDPVHDLDLDVARIAAAATGWLDAAPPPGRAGDGDLASWGGDLLMAYGQWRRDSAGYRSGHRYAVERLGRRGRRGALALADLAESADGYHLAALLRGGATLPAALRDHFFGDGRRTRLGRFHAARFGGTADGVAAVARDLLATAGRGPAEQRAALLRATGGPDVTPPDRLPPAALDGFVRGFADLLGERVRDERALAARLGPARGGAA